MPNPPRLDLVHKAIRSGAFGHIAWQDNAAELVRSDPELRTFTPEGIRALLRKFVLDGNELEIRQETRNEFIEEDPDNPYWYKAIIPIPESSDFRKGLFVEIKIFDFDEDEPWVKIVSSHRQV